MSTDRLPLRLLTILLVFAATLLSGAGVSQAGCLDWLFGRPASYTANYPYAYPSTTAPVAVSPGVVQAQRPAYAAPLSTIPLSTMTGFTAVQSFDNPSVYTGMPVSDSPPYTAQYPAQPSAQYPAQPYPAQPYAAQPYSAQPLPITSYVPPTTPAAQDATAYRLPIASSQPYTTANRVPISSTLRGSANINPIASSPVYTTNYPGNVAPVTYNAAPTSYAPLVPVGPQPQRRFGSGLARFFNSLLGRNTNYVTSYYAAPITYYRPLSTIDPATGTTVTVQQPCSSYVQQLQRVPYNSSFPLQSGTAPLQSDSGVCSTPMLGNGSPQSSFPLAGTPGSFAPPPSGIGQVGGQYLPGDAGITTIPSTIPGADYPNTAPLTGGSPNNAPGSGADPADREPVPQPRLESGRPDLNGSGNATPSDNGSSDNGYLDDYYDNSYRDDLYPYGNSSSEAGQTDSGASEDENRPAIQLDPPVTRQMRNPHPGARFAPREQFTRRTPPSTVAPLSPPGSRPTTAPESEDPQLSTLRPIGVPAGPPTIMGPMTDTRPDGGAAPTRRVIQPPSSEEFPSTREFQAPPLPAPSARGADPSALFRNTETSASSRSPSSRDAVRPRVSVPVREATTRHQSVRQVAAWEDTADDARTRPAAPRQPAPVKRDSGGWLPAR